MLLPSFKRIHVAITKFNGGGGEGAILSTKCMGNMNYAMCCTQKINKAHHLHLPLDPCVRVIIRVSVAFGAERQRNIE